MITIGLIQHISMGRILIKDSVSVGIKRMLKLKSVAILLKPGSMSLLLHYFHTFHLSFTVNVLFSTFFLIFYIFVRTVVSFLRLFLLCNPQVETIFHDLFISSKVCLAYIFLVLFSACILTHSCLWITLVTVPDCIIIWFYTDFWLQSHSPVVTRKNIAVWLLKRCSSLLIYLCAWGEQIPFMKLGK